MGTTRQQYCVAGGGGLLLGAGLLLLAAWRDIRASAALQEFENHLCWLLFIVGCASLALGLLGASAGCCPRRLLLCLYAWMALLLSVFCVASSAIFALQVSSTATRVESDCQEVQIGEPVGQAAQAAQTAYDGMQADLAYCRQSNPNVLELRACPTSLGTSGARWRHSQFWDIFESAEDKYGCSGFCKDGPSLFALPVGSINQGNVQELRPACFSPIMEEVRSKAVLGCSSLLLASVLLLLPCSCACWLACAPPPGRRANYVHRAEELQWTSISHPEMSEAESEESERLLK